ncbi:MAG TPA: hypothetical protein VGI81_13895 [Tepidisphaeraceae bacterium]|jgi:hypothetical protein
MKAVSRRRFMIAGALGAAALGTPVFRSWAAERQAPKVLPVGQKYITSYYQFTDEAVRALAAGALPNGPEYLHVFVQSAPGTKPRPRTAKAVQSCGSSFKYGYAFDLHKYAMWKEAGDDQLKAWATEFRAAALDSAAPADYFAFNEMPDDAPQHPELRRKVAALVRHLHSAGGGPALRGVFYFTQRNLTPVTWVGESEELWEVLDETCDLVVGEHFESGRFVARHTPQQIADLFDVPPRWMVASGDPRRIRIARDKYAVLSSTYYGPQSTNWAGLRSDQASPEELKRFLETLVTATRLSEFGKRRIVFSPLQTLNLDRRLYPILAEVIKADRCGKRD